METMIADSENEINVKIKCQPNANHVLDQSFLNRHIVCTRQKCFGNQLTNDAHSKKKNPI